MGFTETADYGLLSPAWAGTRAAAQTSDQAVLQAMLDVELEWLRVLASAGLITPDIPAAVAPACQASRYDIADLAARAQGGGNPVIPLLADLRALVREAAPAAAGPIHKAATSQDILDSALMLMASRTLETILADAHRAEAALGSLAHRYAGTVSVARTLTQHSLPSTFGLKAAQWLHGVGQATAALESTASALPLQWGGASGTMAALTAAAGPDTEGPLALAADLAARLGLADPVAPWQANRLPVTRLGASLADLLAAAGKISNDVLLLSRPEVGEVSEPRETGRGGSSAMPQKQNPVLSVLIRSAALAAPGYTAMLQAAAGAADDERPGGSWHVEWQALRQLLRLAGGAMAKLAELAEGLTVHTEAVARNLQLAGPLIVSEKVMARVAPLLDGGVPGQGKRIVQDLVARSLAGEDFATLLRQTVPAGQLGAGEIAELLDPANYLGQSDALIHRIISAYPGRNHA